MPKVTVDTVTITKIGDSTSVLAGNKPHVFSDSNQAIAFAREALGIAAFEIWQEKVFRAINELRPVTATEVVNRTNEIYGKSPAQSVKTSAVDICNAALKKLGEKGSLTPAGLAEKKRQEKNRKQRERAAKKRKAAKRKK